jgi:hypothetical protein
VTDLFGQAGITREEKLAELAREIKLRQSVYPRWVAGRKLTQHRADRQLAILVAIQADYSVAHMTGDLQLIDTSAPSPARPHCIEGSGAYHFLTTEELDALGRNIAAALNQRRSPIGQERVA